MNSHCAEPSEDSTEYTDGVTGALVVHPSDPAPAKFPTWDEEIVVQMNDLYHDFSTVLLAEYLSVRGKSSPAVT